MHQLGGAEAGTGRLTELPVRSGADARLADAFGLPGCPLCRERSRHERAYLASLLAEFVNDVPFRAALDRARGFCERHVHAVVAADRRGSGGLLGPAILFHAILRLRLHEVAAAHAAKGRSRSNRVDDARAPARCPICAEIRRADLVSVRGVVDLAADPAWAEAVAGASLCLDHTLAVMAEHPGSAGWQAIEARHLARLEGLRDSLDAFVQRSSHDRRHTITDDQRAALEAAANTLGGNRADDEPHA